MRGEHDSTHFLFQTRTHSGRRQAATTTRVSARVSGSTPRLKRSAALGPTHCGGCRACPCPPHASPGRGLPSALAFSSASSRACNHMRSRLQPYVIAAATICDRGCSYMCSPRPNALRERVLRLRAAARRRRRRSVRLAEADLGPDAAVEVSLPRLGRVRVGVGVGAGVGVRVRVRVRVRSLAPAPRPP